MPIAAGDKLWYLQDLPISSGGIGNMNRGPDSPVGGTVAIKVSAERSARELTLGASLSHANFCHFYDA